jgi:RNA polymerase sigma-70 factor (ECF subfamily)
MHLRSPWQRSRRWLTTPGMDDADGAGSFDVRDETEVARLDPAATLDLVRALGLLADTARAVVWLHDVEGYTHGEIGALFGASASFSKSQLARAHEKLREALQPEGVGNPCIPAPSTY